MRLRVWLYALLFPVVLSAGMPRYLAAARQASQAGTIRVNTGLVQVPVSVSDAAGHAIKDLQSEDFVVEENGSPVPIASLGEPGETRLEMVLVFDLTGSVYGKFDFEQEAALRFLKTIFRQGDAVSVLCIGVKPGVVLERTTSLAEALDGVRALKPSGVATAFFDTVIAAADVLRNSISPETRRVQIVLSDGEDNFSEQPLETALRDVQQSDCIFYAINPGGPSIRLNKVSLRGQQGMETLAEESGGVAFLADNQEALADIYGRIATELQAQYLIGYYTPDSKMDGSFRRITVRLPRQPQLRVRARQGYYAAKAVAR
jgi:Ca-activated chloride channel family protein